MVRLQSSTHAGMNRPIAEIQPRASLSPFPDPDPQGDYQYNVTITDQKGNGWEIVARFEIK